MLWRRKIRLGVMGCWGRWTCCYVRNKFIGSRKRNANGLMKVTTILVFFHKKTSGKKRRSMISNINIQGVEVDNVDEIKVAAITFFSTLYAKEGLERPLIDNLFSSMLEKDEASKLERMYLEEEVKVAVFNIDKDKSPGPDGFSSLFFQECWDIVKEDLMEVFKEFYDRGTVNKSMNATFIVLIPKKEEVTDFSDF